MGARNGDGSSLWTNTRASATVNWKPENCLHCGTHLVEVDGKRMDSCQRGLCPTCFADLARPMDPKERAEKLTLILRNITGY